MTRQERAARARQVMEDPAVKEAIAEMERRAVDDFVIAARWWWGDKRRRIAAEHIREVRDFKYRLEMAMRDGPAERIRAIP